MQQFELFILQQELTSVQRIMGWRCIIIIKADFKKS